MTEGKPTDYVQFKLRVRKGLVKRLQKEAGKRKQSANNEAVERLERSFERDEKAQRDAAIIDMLVKHDDVSSKLLRDIADQIAKHPDWSNSEAERKEMLHWIYISAHGKEPIDENASPFEPWENPTTPRKADK
jgi:hypothetical protein